jgi:protein-tyrosine phosphatase
VVVFPTETVYGVGVRADLPDAVARLRALKGRNNGKPFTLHIGRRNDAELYVPDFGGIGRRMATKGWPGPLTLILPVEDTSRAAIMGRIPAESAGEIYHGGTIGIRCPGHLMTAEILAAVDAPVVAASANLPGKQPPRTAEEAAEALGGQVDLVADGGTARYARSSTIVKIEGDGYSIVREGVYDARAVQRMASLNILMVCTGNTCRSPMAAALLRNMMAEKLGVRAEQLESVNVSVESAGVFATGGMPATAEAVTVLQSMGADLSGHRSQPLTPEAVHQADHIFTMTESHRRAVLDMDPMVESRCLMLDPEGDIPDPIGLPAEEYAACAERIRRAAEARLAEVLR